MKARFSRATLLLTSALVAAPAMAQDNFAEDDSDRIIVTGDILQSNQVASVKTPTPVIDVPQSLSITTEETIEDRGWTSIGQIIDYTPGVNTSQGEGHRDAVVFRGVRSTADFFIDGVRDDVQYYRSLYNIEQVEILRGPNALLFGRGGTGGVLNRVTKKGILGENRMGGQVAIDTFGEFSVFADVNLSSNEQMAFRLNAAYESLNNHRDFYDGDRIGINPTARFALGEQTIIDLSYEYANHERFVDRGIPTGSDGRPVEEFTDIVFGDPEDNFTTLEAHLLRANVSHNFSDNWKAVVNAFYGDYDKVYSNYYASGYDQANTPDIVTLDGYIDTTKRQNFTLSGNLVGEFDTGGISHTLLIGGEYLNTSSDQDRLNPVWSAQAADRAAEIALTGSSSIRTDQTTFVISRPLDLRGSVGTRADGTPNVNIFGDTTVPNADVARPNILNDFTEVDIDVASIYIQDEIKLNDQIRLVLGGRFDSFDITVNNVPAAEVRTRKDEEFSPRLGLIFKPAENISIYGSYSESFLPRSGEQFANINGNNNALDPNTFENLELGLKWDFAERLSFTAAVFEIKQTSPQPNDDDPSTLDVINSTISGFELQAQGEVLPGWTISAGYSYLDGNQANSDLRVRELPQNTFSVWNQVAFTPKFGMGLGLTYQDESFINNSNSAVLPSYTRIDAAAYYEISDNLKVQVNVENLTDTTYFPNSHSTHQATVGAPINARFAITGRF